SRGRHRGDLPAEGFGSDRPCHRRGSLRCGIPVRPLGGLFFGPLADKIGRNRVLAMTMILMASGTFLNGVLPDYATVGLWAPFLLLGCRLLQGFSTGG